MAKAKESSPVSKTPARKNDDLRVRGTVLDDIPPATKKEVPSSAQQSIENGRRDWTASSTTSPTVQFGLQDGVSLGFSNSHKSSSAIKDNNVINGSQRQQVRLPQTPSLAVRQQPATTSPPAAAVMPSEVHAQGSLFVSTADDDGRKSLPGALTTNGRRGPSSLPQQIQNKGTQLYTITATNLDYRYEDGRDTIDL
jgi:hypothetical protein